MDSRITAPTYPSLSRNGQVGEQPVKKFQTPTSKLQRSSKLQAPIAAGWSLEPVPVGVACPLTPALSPDGGEGEETRRCSYRERFQADDHPIAHFRFVRN